MTSLESSAATKPADVVQEVAAAQSASGAEAENSVAQHAEPQHGTTTSNTLVEPPLTGHKFRELVVDTGSSQDEGYSDDNESLTTSINSTVTDYKFEHGRRYHAYQDGIYVLPNDDAEIQRLELQHRIWQLSLSNRLNLAPVPSTVRTALDIGCGTGAWAIEFAERHPNCKVTGADLSPIQPELVPGNVDFIVDDITSSWIYPHKFDYIHSRAITVGIKDWSKLVDEVWANLEPGGWLEFQEYHFPLKSDDDTLKLAPALNAWSENMFEACAKAGMRLDAIFSIPSILEAKGFKNLETSTTKWPLGPWAKGGREKKLGKLCEEDIIHAVEGSVLRLYTKVLGWKEEDVRKHIDDVIADVKARKAHAYVTINFLWAQKPSDTAA